MKNLYLPKIKDLPSEKQEAGINILCYPKWRQRINLGNGFFSPGYITEDLWENCKLPENLKDETFLDIGSNDGMICFKAERMGAKQVKGIDLYNENYKEHSNRKGLSIEGAELAKKFLRSNVFFESMDFTQIDDSWGKWDIVFMSDVLVWLDDPMKALKKVKSLTNKKAFISGNFLKPKANKKFEEDEYSGLKIYNVAEVEKELKKNGFKKVYRKKIRSLDKGGAMDFPLIKLKSDSNIYEDPFFNNKIDCINESIISSLTGIYEEVGYIKRIGWVSLDDFEFLTDRESNFKNLLKATIGRKTKSIFKEKCKRLVGRKNNYVLIAET